jgi:hypothetical protein
MIVGRCHRCRACWSATGPFWSVIDVHDSLELIRVTRDENGALIPFVDCPCCSLPLRKVRRVPQLAGLSS